MKRRKLVGQDSTCENTQTNSAKLSIQTSNELYPKRLKSCLVPIFDQGVKEECKPNRWKYSSRWTALKFLLLDLKRLGYDKEHAIQEVLNWNERNTPPFTQRQIERNVIPFVSWVYEKGGPLGCKRALLEAGICFIKQRRCDYYDEYISNRNPDSGQYCETDFYEKGWSRYLQETHSNGILAVQVYEEIRLFGKEKGIHQTGKVNTGYAALGKRIRPNIRDVDTSPMSILRATRLLEEEGLLKIVERGTHGNGKRRLANGYVRVLPIPEPPNSQKVDCKPSRLPGDSLVTH